jgi:hypothetical protein
MKIYKVEILIAIACFFMLLPVSAQKFSHANKYVGFVSKQQEKIAKRFLDYNKIISYTYTKKSAKKNQDSRRKLIDELVEAKANIDSIPSFKKDSAYKDSALSYVNQCSGLLDDDYKKIENMQEIADQSYENMQSLFLAKESAAQKLRKLNEHFHVLTTKFAATYKVTLDNKKYKIDSAINETITAADYYKPVYLVFFKSYKEEDNLQNAIDRKDDNDFKKARKDLSKSSEAGQNGLDTIKAYKNDNSLVTAGEKLLEYYEKEADDKVDPVSDYFSAMKDFDDVKKTFDKRPGHSGKEVSAYKKEVKVYNKAIKKYNKTMSSIYKKKKSLLNKWTSAAERFIKKHMPTL